MAQELFMFCGVFVIAGVVYSAPNMTNCSDGFKYLTEDTAATFTCSKYGKKVFWYFYESAVGNCNKVHCVSKDSSRFDLKAETRSSIYESTLIIKTVTREQDHFIYCKDSNNEQDSCKVEVIAPALIQSGSCSVGLLNWEVHGTCSIFQMYASDDNYTCAWYKNNGERYIYREFKDRLETYHGKNSRIYEMGECPFTQQMPTLEGNYTYSLRVFPGYGVCYNDTIRISYPGEPTHNCPKHVFEGSDFNCTCKSTKTGSPPAKCKWDVLFNEALHVTNASRQVNGALHICRLLWGPNGYINRSTSYIISVAYGPSAVLLSSNRDATEDGSEMMRFTCTAIDVYPSVVFTWSIKCHNQTDFANFSTCIFNLAKQDEQLSVTCTASNALNETVFVSQTLALPIVTNEAADTAASTKHISGGLIGGVIAAAVIVLVIVAVVAVCIIKRRKGLPRQERGGTQFLSVCRSFFHENIPLSKLYAVVKKPKTQTPIERHSAPSGDLYTVPRSATPEHGEDEYASVYEESDNKAFESESTCDHQAKQLADEIKESTATAQSTEKPAVAVKKFQDISGVYMNVTEVPTDSGLGVYHVVPWALMSGTINPDISKQATSEEEYNALHFEKDRAGQDDAAADYNHIQITQDDYFILERA